MASPIWSWFGIDRAVDLPEARRLCADLLVTHLGSLLPDGRPHVVPLWFVWLDEDVFVTCRQGSRAWANVRRDPRVALQFDRGRSWTEVAGVLGLGRADPLQPEDPPSRRALSAWFEKYRRELSGGDFAAYTEQVPRPALLRVRVEHVATWLHAGRRGIQGDRA